MKRYTVTDVFYTIQGEGVHAGSAAVFIRFTGCNLWDGHPKNRKQGKGACALWCDTMFHSGVKVDTVDLVAQAQQAAIDGGADKMPMVVLSGGEPTLQVGTQLVKALQQGGFYVAMETNGTKFDESLFKQLNHVCVSPKLGAELEVWEADELKVVLPGHVEHEKGWTDEQLIDLGRRGTWSAKFVQPMDPLESAEVENTYLHRIAKRDYVDSGLAEKQEYGVRRCIEFVKANPGWQVSTQTHKMLGVP